MIQFCRRQFIKSAGALALAGLSRPSLAANPVSKPLHGLSAFGDLKYPPDYSQFDYANPDAPQGGTFIFQPSYWYYNQNHQTFNTLNSFVLNGDAPPRMELCFDTLMVWAIDEPDSIYGALAQSVTISQDRNRYQFKLRPQARFHDNSPITSADVAFSFEWIKKNGHPQLALDLRNLERVVVLGSDQVELQFNGKQSDRAILNVALNMPILSKRNHDQTQFKTNRLQPLLASGPWKVGRFSAGQFIEYDRVRTYWANDLGFARGLNHFDTIRIEFFAERLAAFESFKKGDILWREEFTSKNWATQYDFPAVKSGKVVQKTLPGEKRPTMQSWAINSRKKKFSDPKTRQAIGLCFDFEYTNKNLFYGAYQRSHSVFEKSSFKAMGKPSKTELELLEPLRDQLPPEVFGEAVLAPVSNGTGSDRNNLRQAFKLLQQAGWRRKNNQLVDNDGQAFEVEFLIRAKVFEKVLAGFVANLKKLGIRANIRLVDPSQYQSRLDKFDFDIIGYALTFSPNPTRESMRQNFHSKTRDQEGSNNYCGIGLPAVDALLIDIGKAKSAQELQTALSALDRVLRAYYFFIPNWHSTNHRLAFWDVFDWKEPKPDYFFPVEKLWWFNTKKAKALNKGKL